MRWFKHLTAARRDEKLARLFHRSGNSGYGLYFRLLEIVGGEMDNSSQRCSLQYPVSTWAAELKILPQNVGKQLAVLEEVGLITLTADGAEIEIRIPNLLKYRDEYSRKVEQSARAQQGRSKGAVGGTAEPQQGGQQGSSRRTAGSQQLGSGWTADEQSAANSLTYKDEGSEKSGDTRESVLSKIQIERQKESQSTDRELDSKPANERAPRNVGVLSVQEEAKPLASASEPSLADSPDQAPERGHLDGERAAAHLLQLLGTPNQFQNAKTLSNWSCWMDRLLAEAKLELSDCKDLLNWAININPAPRDSTRNSVNRIRTAPNPAKWIHAKCTGDNPWLHLFWEDSKRDQRKAAKAVASQEYHEIEETEEQRQRKQLFEEDRRKQTALNGRS
jgi:hypothetical protein